MQYLGHIQSMLRRMFCSGQLDSNDFSGIQNEPVLLTLNWAGIPALY